MRRLLLLASICLTAAALAACGGSSNSSTSTTTAAGGSTGPTAAQIQARVNLAKCVRSHGIDVPDSAATGRTVGPRVELAQLINKYGETAVQNALNACHADLVAAFPALNLTPAQIAQRRQQVLRFVECLRSHGVSGLPDPSLNGANAGVIGRALSSIDTNSPVFQAAVKACQSVRPTPLRLGG